MTPEIARDEPPLFPGPGGDRRLRDYQLEGLNWLRLNWSLGRNAMPLHQKYAEAVRVCI